jgi:hypothetical protein
LRLVTFKAIFEGLCIADLFGAQGPHQQGRGQGSWQDLLLDMAQTCAEGQYPSVTQFGRRLRLVERHSMVGMLLAALPLLLVHVDRYGHRHETICQWANRMGLSASGTIALGELLAYMGQVQSDDKAMAGQAKRGSENEPTHSPFFTTPCLAEGHRLWAQGQGQLVPGLQLAQQHGGDNADLGLIALLATLHGGTMAIPLTLRQVLWSPGPDAAIAPSTQQGWSMAERRLLIQLSQGLYDRWGGLSPEAHLSEERKNRSIAITI